MSCFTKIENDKMGRTASTLPTAAADGGADPVSASSSLQRRMYYQLENSVSSFQFLIIDGLGFTRAWEPRTHKIQIAFITDDDLDLSNVTWNNQDDLTYEVISSIEFPIEVAYASPIERVFFNAESYYTPVGSYSLDSGNSIYGVRLMCDDDVNYSGDEEVLTPDLVLNIYT